MKRYGAFAPIFSVCDMDLRVLRFDQNARSDVPHAYYRR